MFGFHTYTQKWPPQWIDTLQDSCLYFPHVGSFCLYKTYQVFLSAANTIGIVNTYCVALPDFEMLDVQNAKFYFFLISYLSKICYLYNKLLGQRSMKTPHLLSSRETNDRINKNAYVVSTGHIFLKSSHGYLSLSLL